MLPKKLRQVLSHEGVVAIATSGNEGAHLVNTWNSYVQITADDQLVIPAGYMNKTEENITRNNRVLITCGTREEEGHHGPGTGFLIKGTATFVKSGAEFDAVKAKFPWARAALVVTVNDTTQTL